MNASSRLAWLVVTSMFGAACGGVALNPVPNDSDGGGTDGGTFDASTKDSGPGPTPKSSLCPSSAPAQGTACSTEGTQCEYGDAWWDVACDVTMQCTSGQWQPTKPSFESCTPQPGPNDATCPTTYASVPQGGACTNLNTSCYYAENVCTCQDSFGAESSTAYWACVPGEGCPYPRPMLGSACSGDLSCTYVECGYAQICVNGAWQGSPEACASAGD